MTLNDLNPSQKGFLVNFSQYLNASYISELNCDEMAGVRPRQPAYEIFSIKRRFQHFKSRSPRFMEPSSGGRQRWLPLLKVVILPQLSGVAWKRLQIGTDMLFIINFLRSSAAAQNPRMNCDEKAGDRLTVCEEELL